MATLAKIAIVSLLIIYFFSEMVQRTYRVAEGHDGFFNVPGAAFSSLVPFDNSTFYLVYSTLLLSR